MEEEATKHLKHWSDSLYESRWGEVPRFCNSVRVVLPRLKAWWFEQAFMGNLRDGDPEPKADHQDKSTSGLKPSDVTACHSDAVFLAYIYMSLEIE